MLYSAIFPLPDIVSLYWTQLSRSRRRSCFFYILSFIVLVRDLSPSLEIAGSWPSCYIFPSPFTCKVSEDRGFLGSLELARGWIDLDLYKVETQRQMYFFMPLRTAVAIYEASSVGEISSVETKTECMKLFDSLLFCYIVLPLLATLSTTRYRV